MSFKLNGTHTTTTGPGGCKLYAEVNLGKVWSISKIQVHQTEDKHFHARRFSLYTTTEKSAKGWSYAGAWNMVRTNHTTRRAVCCVLR